MGRRLSPRCGEIASRRLRDVLQAKGYQVAHREYAGDHGFVAWRGTLADGPIALVGKS
jgi:enterochelin esterase-like enzyme